MESGKERCYRSGNEIIGPCGPCSFINLLKLEGSVSLEKELQEIGRLKPFYASDFTAFLLWAEKYDKQVKVFVDSTSLDDGLFDMMFKYEEIPEEKQIPMKEECISRHNEIIERNKDSIIIFEGDPLAKIDELLDTGFTVAFSIAHYADGKDFLVGHLRVAYKREGETYFIKDSEEGLLEIPKAKMKEDLDNVKVMGGKSEIIAFKD